MVSEPTNTIVPFCKMGFVKNILSKKLKIWHKEDKDKKNLSDVPVYTTFIKKTNIIIDLIRLPKNNIKDYIKVWPRSIKV